MITFDPTTPLPLVVMLNNNERIQDFLQVKFMNSDIGVELLSCGTWAGLQHCLLDAPDLITFHYELPEKFNLTISVFIMMITNSLKLTPGCSLTKIAVIIDSSIQPSTIKELKKLNILGIIPDRGYPHNEYIQALQILSNGHSHWPHKILDQINKKTQTVNNTNKIPLTAREYQITELICTSGLPNNTIASILAISESTVKLHISSVLKKYGAQNRTQLALFAGPDFTKSTTGV